MPKVFKLAIDQIKSLAPQRGGCIASDRITVDGARVGRMYRDAEAAGVDSGWRFFAGDETEAYLDNPGNSDVYDVNTIANYDPDIIPFLDAEGGSEYVRDAAGALVQVGPISATDLG